MGLSFSLFAKVLFLWRVSAILYCMFEKYKDIHKDKPAYVFGSGRTALKFYPEEHDDGIYIGINEIFMIPAIGDRLQYLMTEKHHPDIDSLPDELIVFQFRKLTITKPNSFTYMYENHIEELGHSYRGTEPEVKKRMGAVTMAYHGFSLALLMGCNPINLVGCDCDHGKFHPHKKPYNYSRCHRGWQYIHKEVFETHPHVKVIVINPVCLKMFPSITTDSEPRKFKERNSLSP